MSGPHFCDRSSNPGSFYAKIEATTAKGEKQIAIASEMMFERDRQDEKWGEQNHPIAEPHNPLGVRQAFEHSTREHCEHAFEAKHGSWFDILHEELAEVNGTDDPAEQRKELIQLGAVVMGAIECLDRKAGRL